MGSWHLVESVLPGIGTPCECHVGGSENIFQASLQEQDSHYAWVSPDNFIVHGVTEWRRADGIDPFADRELLRYPGSKVVSGGNELIC